MCTNFITLAESNDFRHILQCEHGTVHLTWDLVTLYLNLSEFTRLANLLEQGTHMDKSSKLTESPCMLTYKKSGFYQLWIRNVALNLTPMDFLILVDLVRAALRAAQGDKAPEKADTPAQIFQETVKASARVSFSLN